MNYKQFLATVLAVMVGIIVVLLIIYFNENSIGTTGPCQTILPTANLILDCQATRTAEGK